MKKILQLIIAMSSISVFAQDPCTSISTISCGTAVNFDVTGTGSPDYPVNLGGCSIGSGQGGKEQIYLITPTVTGTYEIKINSTSGFVKYRWKLQSDGCGTGGWNCIGRTNTIGSLAALNLDAGTGYYIFLDAESTGTTTQSFTMDCAYRICDNITPINCGEQVNFASLGFGNPDYHDDLSNCFTSSGPGGKEKIYEFTPTVTGTYEIIASNPSGGFVYYYWKEANDGCNATDWACISRNSGTGSIGAINLTQNVTYWILLNAEGPANISQSFTLLCERVVCNSIVPLECGDQATFTFSGFGDPDYPITLGGSCFISSGQGGKEVIYELPPSSLDYVINVTDVTGGFVFYLWKTGALGCNADDWNCLSRRNTTGQITIPASDSTVYLIVNAEPTNPLSQTFTVSCNPLQRDQRAVENTLTVSPNPVDVVLNIDAASNIAFERAIISDLTGKIVMETAPTNNEVNVGELSPGVYLIKIYSGTRTFIQKFIKK